MSPLAGLSRLLPHAADPRPDGDLLAAFLRCRDEAAFAELVRRHGPVVRAACRRMLPNPTDADDAFQAAFLVLVRRGAGLDPDQPLGPWLHRVAVLTARTLRRGNARRFARLDPPPADVPAPEPPTDLRLDLDAALLALPEKYRVPLVLCHLQGWSRRDAAERLGCPEGTLSSLISRGLAKLKDRLRGYDPAAALAAGTVPVPLTLAASTAKAAAGVGRSPAAVRLAAAVSRGFWRTKVPAAAGLLAVVLAAGYGLAAAGRTPEPGPVAAAVVPVIEQAPAPPPPAVAPAKRIDVCVGGPLGGVPLRATEVGPGEVEADRQYFTGIDRFEHYMAAARAAGPAAPRVRVDVWDHAHPDYTQEVFRACKSAGYSSVAVRGRVKTVRPGGWKEFDDEPVNLIDLVPPGQAKTAPRPRCAAEPVPCPT